MAGLAHMQQSKASLGPTCSCSSAPQAAPRQAKPRPAGRAWIPLRLERRPGLQVTHASQGDSEAFPKSLSLAEAYDRLGVPEGSPSEQVIRAKERLLAKEAGNSERAVQVRKARLAPPHARTHAWRLRTRARTPCAEARTRARRRLRWPPG